MSFIEAKTPQEIIRERIARVETQIGYDGRNLQSAEKTYQEAIETYDARRKELEMSKARLEAQLAELKAALLVLIDAGVK